MDGKEKKFTGKSKKRTFFDRRVRSQGGSRVLSLGKIIPRDWGYVRLTKISETPDEVVVRLERLELSKTNAPITSDDSGSE